MDEYVCPGCRANNMADECWHDERTWALAEAIRDAIKALHPDGPLIPPIEMAWGFIDDADALNGNVGEPPYTVEAFHPASMDAYTTIALVNSRYLFAVPNDEGDATAEFIGDCNGQLVIVTPTENGETP